MGKLKGIINYLVTSRDDLGTADAFWDYFMTTFGKSYLFGTMGVDGRGNYDFASVLDSMMTIETSFKRMILSLFEDAKKAKQMA